MSILAWGALGALVVTLGLVLYWIRGLLRDRAALEQRDAALRVEQERVNALERAAREAALARLEALRSVLDQVRTGGDAARVLREQVSGRRPD